jgi:hypothetical protein
MLRWVEKAVWHEFLIASLAVFWQSNMKALSHSAQSIHINSGTGE